MVTEVHVVGYVAGEVHLLTAPRTTLQEAGGGFPHLPKIVQVVVTADTIPVPVRAQHILLHVYHPT